MPKPSKTRTRRIFPSSFRESILSQIHEFGDIKRIAIENKLHPTMVSHWKRQAKLKQLTAQNANQ